MEFLKEAIDYGIMGFLGLMSLVAVYVAFERHMTYKNIKVEDYSIKKELELILSERLHILGTIAANAPYIGLLGTVLGIMLTFYKMGISGDMDSGSIMSGLALAMKVTAMGLIVAIPAVTLYNLLSRRAKVLVMRWEILNES